MALAYCTSSYVGQNLGPQRCDCKRCKHRAFACTVRSLAIYLVTITDQTVTGRFLICLGTSSDSPTQSRLAKGPKYA